MIKEDYVSLEVAKLLKEKGFDEKVDTYYLVHPSGFSEFFFDKKDEFVFPEVVWLKCPTHQMAMKWLREKHIHIIIDYREVSYKYFFRISYCYNSSENLDFYDSYEEAVEAALKYTLKNLI